MDEAALLDVFADPQAREFYPEMSDLAKVPAWIEWNLRNYDEFGFGLWALELKDSGNFIGDCGLTYQDVEGRRELEIGYHVVERERRKRYATRQRARASILVSGYIASFAVAARVHSARREFFKRGKPALLFYTTRLAWEGRPTRP